MDVFSFFEEENPSAEGPLHLTVLEYNKDPNWRVSSFGGSHDSPDPLEAEASERICTLEFEDVVDLTTDNIGNRAWEGKWNCVYIYDTHGKVVRMAHIPVGHSTDQVLSCGGSTSSSQKKSGVAVEESGCPDSTT